MAVACRVQPTIIIVCKLIVFDFDFWTCFSLISAIRFLETNACLFHLNDATSGKTNILFWVGRWIRKWRTFHLAQQSIRWEIWHNNWLLHVRILHWAWIRIQSIMTVAKIIGYVISVVIVIQRAPETTSKRKTYHLIKYHVKLNRITVATKFQVFISRGLPIFNCRNWSVRVMSVLRFVICIIVTVVQRFSTTEN